MTAADTPAAGSAALNAPIRSREAAALDIAIAALREIADSTWSENRWDLIEEARGALSRIAVLRGETQP